MVTIKSFVMQIREASAKQMKSLVSTTAQQRQTVKQRMKEAACCKQQATVMLGPVARQDRLHDLSSKQSRWNEQLQGVNTEASITPSCLVHQN